MIEGNSPLTRFYDTIRNENYHSPVTLYHSTVYYVLAALRSETDVLGVGVPADATAIAKDITLDQMYNILYEEGLLPYYEYGIPKWYARKYLMGRAQTEVERIVR